MLIPTKFPLTHRWRESTNFGYKESANPSIFSVRPCTASIHKWGVCA